MWAPKSNGASQTPPNPQIWNWYEISKSGWWGCQIKKVWVVALNCMLWCPDHISFARVGAPICLVLCGLPTFQSYLFSGKSAAAVAQPIATEIQKASLKAQESYNGFASQRTLHQPCLALSFPFLLRPCIIGFAWEYYPPQIIQIISGSASREPTQGNHVLPHGLETKEASLWEESGKDSLLDQTLDGFLTSPQLCPITTADPQHKWFCPSPCQKNKH